MRFRSEAEIISQLHHPHVVHILDYDTTALGDPYIVMELLSGETLSRRLYREHTLELRHVAQIVLQTAGGLLVAHAAGIVHRDLKPDNVFLIDMQDNSIFVKLLDFGISKRTATQSRVTREFEVLGTPDYMAPEQIVNSAQTDHRADQWSLAAISYEMLLGRIPFYSGNIGRTLTKVLNEDPPLLCDIAPGVSQAIAEVVHRGLAKSPIDRFPTIMEYAEAFAHAAAISLARIRSARDEGTATQGVPPYRTPPLGGMRSADFLLPPTLTSSEEQTRPHPPLDSESRLPIPTVPPPPINSAGLWPHAPKQTVHLPQSTPPQAATARRSIPSVPPQPTMAPPSSVPPSSATANSRLRKSEPPTAFSISEPPRQSLLAVRLPQREPHLENIMGELRITLEEIRQAVTFGEEQRALSKARRAIQIARNARRHESRELLSDAVDLLRPLLLRALGGSQRRVSIGQSNQVDSSRLSPEHLFLLSRVDGTTTIEELLDTSPLTAAETLGILLDFRDLGCLGIE
jgi:serine/threonine protein kinase